MARDYGSLKSDVSKWLGQQIDTSTIPLLIALAEDRIAGDILVNDQEKSATLDLYPEPVTVPTDTLLPRAIYLDVSNDRQRVDYLSPSAYWAQSPNVTNANPGLPRWFTVEGFELIWTPPAGEPEAGEDPTQAIYVYFARYAALSEDNDTNWLLQNKYGAYLYGALVEAEPYIGNDARLGMWAAMYDEAVDKVNKTARRQRFPRGQKVSTPRSVAVR